MKRDNECLNLLPASTPVVCKDLILSASGYPASEKLAADNKAAGNNNFDDKYERTWWKHKILEKAMSMDVRRALFECGGLKLTLYECAMNPS